MVISRLIDSKAVDQRALVGAEGKKKQAEERIKAERRKDLIYLTWSRWILGSHSLGRVVP
jgi:hypothetical protein